MVDSNLLAQRAADAVAVVTARAGTVVTWAVLIAAAIAGGSYWAGLMALDGGIRTVWIVLGAAFAWISLAGLVRLRWNLARLRRHADDLVGEVRTLIDSDPSNERTVIEVVETTEADGSAGHSMPGQSIMTFSQQFSGLGPMMGAERTQYRWLTRLVNTMKSLISTAAKAFVITGVFAALGLIFLIALAI
jgi:hypothetical protein